jgi:predicted hydrocarbon binding protein
MSKKEISKKNIPYIWLDDELGKPMMMGERCTILFSESISTLRLSLYKLIGDGSDLLLRVIGKDMGKKYAQLVVKQFPELMRVSQKTLIHELCSIILRNTGFGDIEISKLDIKEREMKAIIKDAPSGMTIKSGPVIYHFEAGMLAGILEEIFKEEMVVVGHVYSDDKNGYEVTIKRVE